jgi:serine/threonine protein kinase/Tol biopolymer transport system component
MDSPAPSRLGPYEILSSLGKGGMGEVWRARDPRLNREVAIKVSAMQFTDRFEREAHAIASLNHPNICTLFDIGSNYLVMELIEGPTLAERIAEGPIPLEEALAIARQIADALEAAHEKGIVHRDLKPGNIKIRPDGSVKVLDFGLAKAGAGESVVSSESPTMLHSPTQIGVILGTAAYMAPEQARGKTVDKRADIWSFGVVLHEMLTGKKLFEGEDLADTLASVVKSDPDLTPVPPKVRRLLAKCLQKDPRKRLRDIGDAWDLLERDQPTTVPEGVSSRKPILAWAVAAIAILAAGALAAIHFRETPPQAPLARFSISPPPELTFSPVGLPGTISPDGTRIAFVFEHAGASQIWLRSLDAVKAQPLAGTEGMYILGQLCWSPDSKSIAFAAGNKLKRIDVAGGGAFVLADAPGFRSCAWNRDGVILFAPNNTSALSRVPASGGPAVAATTLSSGVISHRFPAFLPDGKHFLYAGAKSGGVTQVTIHAGSLDSKADQTLLDAESFALYAESRLLFLRGSTLMARPFDANRLSFTGDAVPVTDAIWRAPTITGLAAFSVSSNGWLTYRAGAGGNDLRLAWFDRGGKRLGTLGDAGNLSVMKFSPDRKSVAVTVADAGGNTDIWIYDVERGLRTRFTFDPANDGYPVWSPDGRTIVFASDRKGAAGLYRKAADGSGAEELLYATDSLVRPVSFSPDGRYLAYDASGAKPGVWILPDPLGPPRKSTPYSFLQAGSQAQFSRDGKWIAYSSVESGRLEVYVAPFPGPGGKKQVSAASGVQPCWSVDGKELFYVAGDRLTVAQVDAKNGAFVVGKTQTLFGPMALAALGTLYDVSADGQRILAVAAPEGQVEEPMTLVQNWTAGLKK